MGIFPYLWEFEESLLHSRKLRVQQKMGISHFYRNWKKALFIVECYVFCKIWEFSHFYRNFPIFMGIFPYLWEFEENLHYCRKLRIRARMRNFPIFIGIFPFLWEFSHFYRNLKKTCPIVESYVFSKKWELSHFFRNFPIFMGIFQYLSEFEESLLYSRMLRVLQKMGSFSFL